MDELDDVNLDDVLGVEEAPQPPNTRPDLHRRKMVCKHWLRGLCKRGDMCDFLHRLDHDRMPECWYFQQFGECGNKECIFLHVKPDEKSGDCPWFARGFCKHGQRCRARHRNRKPCPRYLAGFCPDGPDCKLGHAKCAAAFFLFARSATQRSLVSRSLFVRAPRHRFEIPATGGGNYHDAGSVTCYACGQQGHYANQCPNRAQRK